MNLNTNPILAQLQALTQQADDEAGNHILWVDQKGEVHLSLIPEDMTPNGFEDSCLKGNLLTTPRSPASPSFPVQSAHRVARQAARDGNHSMKIISAILVL